MHVSAYTAANNILTDLIHAMQTYCHDFRSSSNEEDDNDDHTLNSIEGPTAPADETPPSPFGKGPWPIRGGQDFVCAFPYERREQTRIG